MEIITVTRPMLPTLARRSPSLAGLQTLPAFRCAPSNCLVQNFSGFVRQVMLTLSLIDKPFYACRQAFGPCVDGQFKTDVFEVLLMGAGAQGAYGARR